MLTTVVRPSIPQSEHVVRLSTLDQCMPRKHLTFVFCFQLDGNISPCTIIRQLKQSLAAALTELPQFAGVIQPAKNDRKEVQLYIEPESGSLFRSCSLSQNDGSSAQGTEWSFDGLAKAHFPLSYIEDRFQVPSETMATPSGVRCLAVQANFINGGLILAIHVHHSLTDAWGFAQLLSSWSRHMQLCSQQRPNKLQPSSRNATNRWQLSYGTKNMRLQDVPEFRDASILGPTQNGGTVDTSILTTVVWHISREHLESLRVTASSGASSEAQVSSIDALLALLWRHISLARWSSSDGKIGQVQSSVLCVPVSLRLRMVSIFGPYHLPFARRG